MAKKKITPMLQQFLDIKKENPDSILFFRVGDFYEMFFDDAEIAARELEIVLTSRDAGEDDPIPLAGVPYHSCETYIARLLEKGYKVAICDQVEDPRKAKGLVKREVTQIVTPGTVLDTNMLNEKENNYIASVYLQKNGAGLSFVDVSTGEFLVTEFREGSLKGLKDEILRINPKEIIMTEKTKSSPLAKELENRNILITKSSDSIFYHSNANKNLLEHFNTYSLEGFGLGEMNLAIRAAGALLDHLHETQKNSLEHIKKINPYTTDSYLVMDINTRKNLELCESIRDNKKYGSLLWVLDRTMTAMGGRMLRKWVHQPLIDKETINKRLDYISSFIDNFYVREELREKLKQVYDLERVLSRVVFDRATPRDLISLKNSLNQLPVIKDILNESGDDKLTSLSEKIILFNDLSDLLESAIVPDPPITIKEGGIIREGYDEKLDELRDLASGGREWIANLEAQERERTGIKSLKVRYNKVFGYYIEVTKANLDHIPDDYIRKQTLVNAERFLTPELKEYESQVLGAEEKMADLEYEIFQNLRKEVSAYSKELQDLADFLAELDCLLSLSRVALENNYTRPEIDETTTIDIKEGRHPVIEQVSGEEPFVPNDTYLDNEKEQIAVITGPNMAGKSTYMRQVAIITLMAQMGSFVPCESARIGIVDKIFTRVGATDDLVEGQSTFMVEMNEVANILNNATGKSLIILDEVGRGTSTFDGIALAKAVVEYLHQEKKVAAKTLFATHFHELVELADEYPRVSNYSIAVSEKNDKMIFLRKIQPGGVDKSYGVQVASLAGLPDKVIKRAKEHLNTLETKQLSFILPVTGDESKDEINKNEANNNNNEVYNKASNEVSDDNNNYDNDDGKVKDNLQENSFAKMDEELVKLKEVITDIEPDELSPKEALEYMYYLKEIWNSK
ncbi:DNA mismatch repair protein MutS [Natranaerofaba carboxydovora]|uniref:DNA mismatch repair protein MutS n=1 Tax=Natranaerofaba carboxydovora TaxID=2742683 RepID=UPI001F1376DB|nr:DNA mismatch repair protein MutS [Natranaerofaba carboxydovora]UMZ73523.1 DNA mismatch repair protein MutS [Natranaerofaba carboxydovora]